MKMTKMKKLPNEPAAIGTAVIGENFKVNQGRVTPALFYYEEEK